MATIDPKPSNRRWDSHPRVARKAKPKVALDDTEAHLVLPEKQYRELLFRDFVRFCREHGGIVVSVPWCSPAIVLVELGENSPLEKALQAIPRFKVTRLPGTAIRLSHSRFREMQRISVVLWP